MTLAILAVIIVSGVGGFLATLLVFAENKITNYGEVEVDINEGERKFTVKGGGTLLETLAGQKIFIPSACGGRGTCAYCKVKVLEGAGALLPTEEPYMTAHERKDDVRLACQVKVRNTLKIEIPADILSIREYQCQCDTIIDLTYDIKQFNLSLVESKQIDYTPGQYVQLIAPKYEKSSEEVSRAYSVSSDPADKTRIELIVRRVPEGICTTYLFDYLKKGDPVQINGPYGEFFLRDTEAFIIFIAGGSGIAPIKCMLHHMKNTNIKRKAIFFFGVRSMKDLFLVDEMKQFEKDLVDFTFVPVVSQPEEGTGWNGAVGRVTDVAAEFLKKMPALDKCEGYLCGSPGMINAAVELLASLGVPRDKHFYDKFA
jgi:Na+-transporting NADH:ubiquinone oxidoreductase subunit F